jgi:hypothetical protein
MNRRYSIYRISAVLLAFFYANVAFTAEATGAGNTPSFKTKATVVNVGNLVYAGTKTSKCFSDKFLSVVGRETNIVPAKHFESVKLSTQKLYDYPFSVMTGEGLFTLRAEERVNLRDYLMRGGFLLASAGCSSDEWDQSFRREVKKVFPEYEFKKLTMDHSIFSTVFDITRIKLKKDRGNPVLEGLEIDGRIVLLYSKEGLNDTANAGGGCCCCGGNEVKNSQEINVNVFTYSLTH